MMEEFSSEESYKVQAVLDLFEEYFPFTINGKNLETLISQGGMGVDTSTSRLALECGRIGCAGTIATTFSSYLKELDNLKLNKNDIVGINNLVKANDYEKNYKRFVEKRKNFFDFIASGAGITNNVQRRLEQQGVVLDRGQLPDTALTIPLVSDVSQLPGLINLGGRFIILETLVAGGHNGIKGKDFDGTIEEFKSGKWAAEQKPEWYDKKDKHKLIIGGGIRTPKDFVKAIDAGFDAVQIGTLFLLAEEANIFDDFRGYILNAKPGDVGKIPSPAGLPAMGFVNKGIMEKVLKGEYDSKKLECYADKFKGCLDCTRIDLSARFAGYSKEEREKIKNYCILTVLHNIHNKNPEVRKKEGLYFSGMEPERSSFIIDYMKQHDKTSLAARIIIGKMLAGVYDEISNLKISGRIKDEHKKYLEGRFNQYKHDNNPEQLKGKIFQPAA